MTKRNANPELIIPDSYLRIQNDCIRDHKSYIKSYVKHQRDNEIRFNYDNGINRYEEIKGIMRDVTIHYPQLMAFLLNHTASGTCTSELCRNMSSFGSKKGQHNQTGGNKEAVIDIIQKHAGGICTQPVISVESRIN